MECGVWKNGLRKKGSIQMLPKNRHEKVTKIISTVLTKLGEKQIVVAIEEMAELTQALTKYIRITQGGQAVRTNLSAVKANIQEELADVQIVVMELMQLFGIEEDNLYNVIEQKLLRTVGLIENDNGI